MRAISTRSVLMLVGAVALSACLQQNSSQSEPIQTEASKDRSGNFDRPRKDETSESPQTSSPEIPVQTAPERVPSPPPDSENFSEPDPIEEEPSSSEPDGPLPPPISTPFPPEDPRPPEDPVTPFLETPGTQTSTQAFQNLRQIQPIAQRWQENSKQLIYGGGLSLDYPSDELSAEEVADLWIQQQGDLLGESGIELLPQTPRRISRSDVFLFPYQQWMDGLPVEKSFVRLHIRLFDNQHWRVTFVSSQLAPVPSSFGTDQLSGEEAIESLWNKPVHRNLNSWEAVEKVMFFEFGVANPNQARRAWKVVAADESHGAIERISFYVDAETGDLLYQQNEHVHLNANGNVQGFGTPGIGPHTEEDLLENFSLEGLYILNVGNVATVTDQGGSYSLPFGGVGPETIRADLLFPYDTGTYGVFVENMLTEGPVTSTPFRLETIISSSQTVDFQFNNSGNPVVTDEEVSGVNVYRAVRSAYNLIQDLSGGLGILDSQSLLAITNNESVECNAVYVPDGNNANPAGLLFYAESNNCYNSAYSTVAVHEYGHHFVNRLGLAQNAFGEGFADVLAMMVYDEPGVGFNLFKDEEYLRNPHLADVSFPCASGSIHYCGQVLGGLWWDIRRELGLSAARQLFVDWAQVTTGGTQVAGIWQSATNTTVIEILQADDDVNGDSNYENGTPNQEAICSAAENHGLSCPILLNFAFTTNPPRVILPGQSASIQITVTATGAIAAADQPNTGVLYYRIDGGDWQSSAMTYTDLSPADPPSRYDVSLPALEEGQRIEFYFSVNTTNGFTAYLGSLEEPFVALSELPARVNIVRSLPRELTQIFSGERKTGFVNSRIFLTSGIENSTLVSFQASDFTAGDLDISRLPDDVLIGAQSLFYQRGEDVTRVFAFTDNSRRRVYFGTNTHTNVQIDTKFCGEFQEISAISITETGGGMERLLVADRGAGKLFSFAIDQADGSLCTNEVSIDIPEIHFLLSPNTATPNQVIVGYRTQRDLWIRRVRADTLGSLAGADRMSYNRDAVFGSPLNLGANGVFIPVLFANHPNKGDDYLQFYSQDFSASESVPTCRSPDRIRSDHSRYIYVLCKLRKRVQIFDRTNRSLIGEVLAGDSPKNLIADFVAGPNNSYIGIQQSNRSLLIYTLPQGFTNLSVDISSQQISLPADYDFLEQFALSDRIYALDRSEGLISEIDLSAGSVVRNIFIPRMIDDLAAQSASALHFVSKEVDRAYSFEAIDSTNWRLRSYVTGDRPVRVDYDASRLYVLNENDDSFQIFNTSTGAQVALIPTQDRPIDFVLDRATRNEAWIINRNSASFTTVNVANGSEALIGHTAVGFSPRLIEVGSGGIFVAGGDSLAVFNTATRALVRSESLEFPVSDIAADGNDAILLSSLGATAYEVTAAGTTARSLSGGPQYLVGGAHRYVLGIPNSPAVQVLGAPGNQLIEIENPFSQMFQTASHLVLYDHIDRALRFYLHDPSDAGAGVSPNSFNIDPEIRPTLGEGDAAGNLWFSEPDNLRFQMIGPDLQPERVQNRLLNRPVDITTGGGLLFVSLRNNDGLYVYNPGSGQSFMHQVCDRPERIEYDSTGDLLYVMCPDSNSVAILDFSTTGTGVLDSIDVLSVGNRPSDIALWEDSYLFVANQDDRNVTIYDLQNNFVLVDTIALSGAPKDIFFDATAEDLFITVPYSDEIFQIQEAGGNFSLVNPPILVSGPGFEHVVRNQADGETYAIASTPQQVFQSVSGNFINDNIIVTDGIPRNLAFSEAEDKVFVLYPLDRAVRILDEDNLTARDVALGAYPREILLDEANTLAFFSNFESQSVSVVNYSGAGVLAQTVSGLGENCGPTKMALLATILYVLCERNDRVAVIPTTGGSAFTLSAFLSLRVQD